MPIAHGGWGFLLEPILLGLWVVPSLAGMWLGIAALGVFLLQQPLKLALSDWYRKRRYPRSVWAERFVLIYAFIVLLAFGLAIINAQQHFWLPLLLALPLAAVQLYYDARNQGRDLIPEIFGALTLGAIASAVAMVGGWLLWPALILWFILAVRAVTSIIYVRARLRLEREQPIAMKPVWLVHLLGLLFVAGLVYLKLAPWLALLAVIILWGRAIFGLSAFRHPARARNVGVQEIGYGFLTVLLTALGYTLQS